jgi:hypothetical protein
MSNIDLYMTLPTSDTNGGDLDLAAPSIDSSGTQTVDLAITYGTEVVKQIVYNRIRTQAPDWFVHPTLGGNLDDLIGEPNTKDTAQRGVKSITEALTYGKFLSAGDFSITAVPVNREEVLFAIRIKMPEKEIVVPIQFSYNYGLKLVG